MNNTRQASKHLTTGSVMILLLCMLINQVEASEVSIPYQGMKLKASLTMAADKKMSDGVILITHGGLAHHGMELIAYLQDQFKQRGYNTLAISLSLGISDRGGMYDCKTVHRHRHEDAVAEIKAWSQWLTQQGVTRWVLLGHSRGGGQSALFAHQEQAPGLKALVLMSPQTKDNGAEGYQQRYQQPLKPLIEKARTLVKSGKGDTVLEHANMMFCGDTPVTAASFISYYGGDSSLDTPSLLPDIKLPILVTVAENDREVINLDQKLQAYLKNKNIKMEVIAGSDHVYRDLNADDAVDVIVPFIEGLFE